MQRIKSVAVLGAGSWGTVLANLLVENGQTVKLWTRDAEQAREINVEHMNKTYLPENKLHPNLKATTDLGEAVTASQVILFVLPTLAIRSVAKQLVPFLTEEKIIVHASKGLEQETHLRISDILQEELPTEYIKALVVLSGPSHAEEVIVHDWTSITAASTDIEAAELVQDLFMNDFFRVYTNTDVIGVEYGGALKNIIALGAGMLRGVGGGDNALAALITRGLAEISRLGEHMGADPMTFIGLSGVGDLVVTAMSEHSRNYRAGFLIGQGKTATEAIKKVGMVVEGFYSTSSAYELAQTEGIDMPITAAIYRILTADADPKGTIVQLMLRDKKAED